MTEEFAALYVVPTPLGNLADLTRRAEEVLRSVPWVAAEDTRHSGPLLKQLGSRARRLPAHRHNEHEAAARIVERLKAGEAVALISDAGTPGISDPGARIVAAVRAAGCKVIPLPGACAAITALSASGLPDEHFLFHGFLPSKAGQRRKAIACYLAYRRDGGENHSDPGRLFQAVTQALRAGQRGKAEQIIAQYRERWKNDKNPEADALQAIVAGRRDGTLADAPDFDYTMAAEILLLIETLDRAGNQRRE